MKKTFKEKLISEALDFYRIDSLLDDEFEYTELDHQWGSNRDTQLDDNPDEELYGTQDDEFSDFQDDEEFSDEDETPDDFQDDEPFEDEDKNKVGLIRSVKGAYLVYKRLAPDNNYEELWVYNISDVKSQTRIRNSILAGTDVDPIKLRSSDGEQSASLYSKGNVQFLHVIGLPN